MRIKIDSKLKKLAKIFGQDTPLYIVGGYVRDCLAGYKGEDIDLASSLTLDKVKSRLAGSNYTFKVKNATLGTAIISCCDKDYEYSTFRTESYSVKGVHSPDKVTFSTSIVDDSKRRDFSMNCIYYNILTKEIVDFYGGQRDIDSHTIKCIESPEVVLKEDGHRIMRMIRLSAELGFTIDEHTYAVAMQNIDNLGMISNARIGGEFFKILGASFKYKNHKIIGSGRSGIKIIDRLEIWEYINKQSDIIKQLSGIASFVKCFDNADKSNYLLSFLTDAYLYIHRLNADTVSPKELANILYGSNGANIGKNNVAILSKQLELLLQITDKKLSEKDFTILVATRHPELVELKSIISILSPSLNDKIKIKYKSLIKAKAPTDIYGLAIGIEDLQIAGWKDRKINMIYQELYHQAICDPTINTREKLLGIIKEYKENK